MPSDKQLDALQKEFDTITREIENSSDRQLIRQLKSKRNTVAKWLIKRHQSLKNPAIPAPRIGPIEGARNPDYFPSEEQEDKDEYQEEEQ